ncbi:MAG: hypothetical protein GY696_24085 [Gammaproteobacteria bacterium]|nr:hypothetical protein [Gammaproteobacteria bacterium]
MKELYWWSKMGIDVDSFVRNCLPCQASGKSSML